MMKPEILLLAVLALTGCGEPKGISPTNYRIRTDGKHFIAEMQRGSTWGPPRGEFRIRPRPTLGEAQWDIDWSIRRAHEENGREPELYDHWTLTNSIERP